MMTKLGGYFLAACLVFYAATSVLDVEGAYIPHKSNALQEALKALKTKSLQRTGDVSGSRQKRYTDYQERASAFCTGLCMYEERKGYSDCFDVCNYY